MNRWAILLRSDGLGTAGTKSDSRRSRNATGFPLDTLPEWWSHPGHAAGRIRGREMALENVLRWAVLQTAGRLAIK